jgi:ribosome-binding protein aMBF1 (putative translation factor)
MTVTLARPGAKPRVFTVPAALGRKMESFLKQAEKEGGSIPAEIVFPALADDTMRPATALRGSRYKEGWTQAELAGRLGIRQNHLSEMENGKRPIGKNMAKKLAEVFECDFRVFF